VKLKQIANGLFLTLSCFLIAYFLIQLTDNWYIRAGILVFAVSLDVLMQYILGLGIALFSHSHKVKAITLFICYAIYVIVYAVPSAIGFFSVEIGLQEQSVNREVISSHINENRIKQIDSIIVSLNKQLDFEANSGYGSRSSAIMVKIEALNAEQKELLSSYKPTTTTKLSKNIFDSLSQMFGLNSNLIKVLMFGISVGMLYIGLILTHWDIKIDEPEFKGQQSDFNRELAQFVDAMYEFGYKRLNGNGRISSKTGIPIERCAQYRSVINQMEIDGTPVVNKVQGASVANVDKEKVLEHIKGIDNWHGR
jgi:hypothetical protein